MRCSPEQPSNPHHTEGTMNLKAFSILDTKADTFNVPFFMRTTGEAVRAFADLANDPQSNIYRHPDDYRLFHVADFDQELGAFSQLPKPIPLGSAAEFKKPDHQVVLPFPGTEKAS